MHFVFRTFRRKTGKLGQYCVSHGVQRLWASSVSQSLYSWNNVYPTLWLCWKLFNPNCLYSLQVSVHVSQVTVEDAVTNVKKTTLAILRCIAFVSIINWDNWLDINAYLLYSQGRQGIHVEKQPFICLCVWDGQVFMYLSILVFQWLRWKSKMKNCHYCALHLVPTQTLVCFYLEMHLFHALIPQKRNNWM